MRTTAALICLALATVAVGDDRPEFKPMFNGKDFTGWTADEKTRDSWSIEDDRIVFDGRNRGWLMFDQEFEHVYVQFEYRIEKDGNSGAALRSPLEGDPAFKGMEIQIVDDEYYASRRPKMKFHTTGSLYGVKDAEKKGSKPAGEWNTIVMMVRDDTLVVDLNRTDVLAVRLDQLPEYDEAKFTGIRRKKGHFGLQGQSGRIEFRNLKYAQLKSKK